MSIPIHNYSKQIIFSHEKRDIGPNNVINWSISASADNNYFDLYKSTMTLKLKIDNIEATDNDIYTNGDFYCQVKASMSGLVDNTKVTYVYRNQNGELVTLALSTDNQHIGQIRELLSAMTDNKHDFVVNEGLDTLSYINVGETAHVAHLKEQPRKGELFFPYLKFKHIPSSRTAYCNVVIPFKYIFEGCGSEKFVNLTQMDAEIILKHEDEYFYRDEHGLVCFKADGSFSGAVGDVKYVKDAKIYIDTCYLNYHVYKTNDDDSFDPEDTTLSKNQIQIKSFDIPKFQTWLDQNIIVNFPVKVLYIFFTKDNYDFSNLLDVKMNKINLCVAGEQARHFDCMNDTPHGKDRSFFEFIDYINNARSDDYDTLLTYKSWINQFRVLAFPVAEFFSQKASNQYQINMNFDGYFDNDGSLKNEAIKMHCVFIRANAMN